MFCTLLGSRVMHFRSKLCECCVTSKLFSFRLLAKADIGPRQVSRSLRAKLLSSLRDLARCFMGFSENLSRFSFLLFDIGAIDFNLICLVFSKRLKQMFALFS